MSDVRAPDDPLSVTVGGTRGAVFAYVADQLAYLDAAAARTGTPPISAEQMPLDRLEHIEGLVRIIRGSVRADGHGTPSPHYLRSLAAQTLAWLEELRDRREVSW